MPSSGEIIDNLKKLPNDRARIEYLVNNDGMQNAPPLIHHLAKKHPETVVDILQTLTTPEARSQVMGFQYLTKSTPLAILDNNTKGQTLIAAVLKCLTAEDRLKYIRKEESGATEYGDITKPEFKYINYIIYCDLYLEHLQKSLSENSVFSPDEAYKKSTLEKIEAVKIARAILEKEPESDETMQAFRTKLSKNKALLETRRDTWLTFFLKCVGVVCSAGLAYHSLFVHTDGKDLLEKTEAIDQQNHQPKP